MSCCWASVLACAPCTRVIRLRPVGTQAPDFTLNSQEGKPVSLRDFKGKWVVALFLSEGFYDADCTVEAHNFQRDLAQYESKECSHRGREHGRMKNSHQQFCYEGRVKEL